MAHEVRVDGFTAVFSVTSVKNRGKYALWKLVDQDGTTVLDWRRHKLWKASEKVSPSRQFTKEAEKRAKEVVLYLSKIEVQKLKTVSCDIQVIGPVVTVGDWFERAQQDPGNRGRQMSDSSVAIRKSALTQFVNYLERFCRIKPKDPLTKITKQVINQYVDQLLKGGLDFGNGPRKPTKRKSVQRHLCVIKRAFNWMLRNDEIVDMFKNPADIESVVYQTNEQAREGLRNRSIDPETRDILLNACSDELVVRPYIKRDRGFKDRDERVFKADVSDSTPVYLKSVMQILSCTGMRPGELLNARWDGMDWEKRTLTTTGKTGIRTVALPKAAIQYLKYLLKMREKVGLRSDYVICNEWGKPINVQVCGRAFSRLRDRLGLDKSLELYCFRHAFAHHLVDSGVHVTKIKSFMGHTRLETTMQYCHSDPEDNVADLDGLF